MIEMDLQLFGGRGARLKLSDQNNHWSDENIPSESIPKSMKEAIGNIGKPMTMKEARKANPRWSAEYKEYSENYQRCVVAYELRRRGYNVTAQPTFKGDKLPDIAYTDKSDADYGKWQGAFRKAHPINVSGRTYIDAQHNIERQMRNYGENSRAVITVYYRNGGGHVFNTEWKNGRIHYMDAQTNESYDARNVLADVNSSNITLTRVDHLKLSYRIKDFVWTRK